MKKGDDCENDHPDVAKLGVDGNCAYAMLGICIATDIAEFVEIISTEPRFSEKWLASAKFSAREALKSLQRRVSRVLDWEFDHTFDPRGNP